MFGSEGVDKDLPVADLILALRAKIRKAHKNGDLSTIEGHKSGAESANVPVASLA
jgi:hypothetical protein